MRHKLAVVLRIDSRETQACADNWAPLGLFLYWPVSAVTLAEDVMVSRAQHDDMSGIGSGLSLAALTPLAVGGSATPLDHLYTQT